MRNIILMSLIVPALLLNACKQGDGLKEKKEKLAKLKEEQAAAETEIKKLQTEVDKLDPQKAVAPKIVPVKVTAIQTQAFSHFIDVQGTVESEDNMLISPAAPGKITRVYVKVGQSVSRGQLLATVDNSVLVQSMQELETQLELTTTLFNKQKGLWDQKIGSEVQYLNAKTQKEGVERRMQTLRTQIAQTNVTSPISGTVDAVNLKEGEVPMPGLGGIRVVNLSDLKVTAKLADSYIPTVKVGESVSVRLPDINKEMKATITFVGKVVDPNSRTFGIEVRINEGRELLRPNMIAIVKINDRTDNAAIVVDQNIIQNTEEGAVVYIAEEEGGKKVAKRKPVKSGLTYGGKAEITEGLKAGDQLVTTGYQDLVDGTLLAY
ncbi:MAG: efflux RND transporter periplasmic adaptor subunit [Bacteroidota bacterium]